MSQIHRRLVRRHGASWQVLAPGASRVSFSTPDRGDAVARAKRIVRNLGGGEVHVVHEEGPAAVIQVAGPSRAATPDLRVR